MAFVAQPASPRQGYPAAPLWQSSPPPQTLVPSAPLQMQAPIPVMQPRALPAQFAAPTPPAPQVSPRWASARSKGPEYGTVRARDPLIGQSTEKSDWSRALVFSYTLALFGCCAAATVLCLQLGMDPDVVFWIGRWGLLALLVPVFILAMFVFHLAMLKRGTPNKRIFIWAIVAPGIYFCIMGGVFMQQGSFLYGQLKSSDCSGGGYLPEKKRLQDAYDAALSVYGTCVTRLYYENGGEPLESRPTLFGCDEWDNLHDETEMRTPADMRREWGPGWSYLATVEADHICSGWCKSGSMLWTSYEPGPGAPRVGGRCSSYVAQKFLTVSHLGRVILFVELLTIIIAFVYYIRLGNALIELGYK